MRKLYPTYFGMLSNIIFYSRIRISSTKQQLSISPNLKILLGFLLAFALSVNIAYSQLPDQFQRVDLVTNLANATTFKFAPDGRIFILDRYGEIIIYKPDLQTTVSAGTLSVFHEFEDGLLGIAFDPNFVNNNYIYLHYSPLSASVNRVSQFTMNGDTLDLSSEVVVLEWGTQRTCCFHSGGDMDFDSQGNLYIATGDNTNHSPYATFDESDSTESSENTSSNTNDLRGKILRIKPQPNGTYTIPSGNLFPGGTGGLPEIYVMGARNPYRIFVDKDNTDWLFWGEVGPDANVPGPSGEGPEGKDEINLTKSAGNYGWPYFSGENEAYLVDYVPTPYYNDPSSPQNISTWNTGATNLPAAQPSWLDFFHACYLAGPRYYYDAGLTDQKRLPVEFDGRFFYYDFNSSQIWVVEMDAQGNILGTEQLAPSIFPSSQDGFLDMKIGPDGYLYVLAYGVGCCPQNAASGKLIRVDYIGITTNSIPVVTLDASPTDGSLPLVVNFSSDGTFDPDGDFPLTYSWDFETDGIIDSNAENPTHTYLTPGTFNAQLRVDDGNGGIGVKNVTIYAGNNKATFSFNSPLDGGLMNWGDDISLDLEVNDLEDGSTSGGGIDCNDVNVVPSLGHLNHFHDEATISGCPQTITLDYDGHDISGEMDLFYVLGTNYTDTGGLISFDQIQLHPKRKEAEFYDSQNDVLIISNTDPLGGGSGAIRVNNDSYISLNGRNLANINSVKYRVAAPSIGGQIEFRLGSPTGTVVATTNVPVTGGSATWIDVETNFVDPGGKNDLFFVFKAGAGQQDIFDLNYIEFIGPGVSTDNTPPEITSVVAVDNNTVRIDFSEYVTQGTAENLSNYSIDNGITISSATLLSNNLTVELSTSTLSSSLLYNLTVSGVQNVAGLTIVTDSYTFYIFDAIRVNTGGPEVTAGGEIFIAEQYSSGGDIYSNNVPISGTPDDELYQSERYGTFSYEIPIPVADEYDIRLHFAEIFFGVGANPPGGIGTRVFNVALEGNEILSNFDILAEVPVATALIKEFDNVSIVDGVANFQFTNVVDNAKISAIEILPKDTFSGSGASVTITSPKNGWDVNQPFEVNFNVQNWEIVQGGTHMHYFVDGAMVGPHYSYEPITIDGLSLGTHTIRLELFDVGHVPTGIFDEVTVNVTASLSCNDNEFPTNWQVHQLQSTELPYRAVYIYADHDLDGDGLKDIVTGGWWYKNPGTASGNWIQNTIGSPLNNVAHVYDFDGDGDMDLLGTQGAYEGSDMAWAQNDGAGNFTVYTNIPSGTTSYSEPFLAGIAGGIFDGGSQYQMAINWNGAEVSGSQMQLLTVPNDPVNTTWTMENLSPDSLGEDIDVGDIDRDTDLDLFQAGNWLQNDGSGNFTTNLTGVSYVTTFDRSALADFDRDGDLDGVVGQLGLGSDPDRFEFAWFEAPSDPTLSWSKNVLATDIQGSLSVFAEDMDLDGDEDIIVGEWLGQNRLIAFENDLCNSGTWIRHTLDAGGTGFDHHDGAQVTDIDNDGDLDIISIGWDNIIPRIFENKASIPGNKKPVADAGPDQTIFLPTTSTTLNGAGNDPDGGAIAEYLWNQESGPSTATLSGQNTADLTVSDLIEGQYVFRLTVTDDESDTAFDDVIVTVAPETSTIRINSGGPSYTFNSISWSADQYFVGGDVFTSTIDIANTSNDQLYHSERYATAGTLSYEIPVSNGTYNLNLHFAEIFYGLPGEGSSGGAGSRVFNIDVENGEATISNYDIVVAAGGSATAVIENFTNIVVNDGFLSITLTGVIENPKISGIEVFNTNIGSLPPLADAGPDIMINLPTTSVNLDGSGSDQDGGSITAFQWTQQSGPSTATLSGANTDNLVASDLIPGSYVFRLTVTDDEGQTGFDDAIVVLTTEPEAIRINSGGPTFTFGAEEWMEDQYNVGGGVFENVIAIANTENDQLYQTERFNNSGTLIYEIPVSASGNYNIALHFAEIFFGAPGGGSGGAGSRVFNIDIENGQEQINNYDIVVAAGGSATAVVENFTNVMVSDGFITITLTSVIQNPKISGIEFIQSIPPIVDAGEDQTLTLPTNSTTVTGTANDPDGGEIIGYLWQQISGPNTATLFGENTATLEISNLIEGTYVFRLNATDDENDVGLDEIIITVLPENTPPTAIAEAVPVSGAAPLSVQFTGSNSFDDVGIESYEWDFDDGSPTSNEVNPEHVFTLPGTYEVSLTVTDADGLTDTDIITINVSTENEPPVAVIEANPITGMVPLIVNFTGSNSTDDQAIISYSWDFGDGQNSIDPDPVHTYNSAGEYTVVLTVTDDQGLTSSASIIIMVFDSNSEEFILLLMENPTQGGMAKVSVLNRPSDTVIMAFTLHDTAGRYINLYDPQQFFVSDDYYELPVGTFRNGIYYLTVETNKGDRMVIKLAINN